MNKKTFIKAACLVLASAMAVGCFAACTTVAERADVIVTVTGGTGSGTYKEGDMCVVTAPVAPGSEFLGWQVYGITVSTANPYTFRADFDIELTALYEVAETTQFTVTVNGGMIGENGPTLMEVAEGTELTIYPDESQARRFTNWLIGDTEVTDNPYTFTVTGNTEITAEFDEYCMISVSGGTVNGGRSDIVPQGSEVTIKANADNEERQFAYWYTLDENFAEVRVADTPEYTFVLNGSTKIYASFLDKFNVTVVNGTIDGTGEAAANVVEGSTVTLVPDAAPEEDKAFIGWYIGGERVSADREYELSVSKDTAVEAKYGPLSKIQLKKPDSSANTSYPTTGLIYPESSGSIALDRLNANGQAGVTMFTEGVEYVRYDIYDSPDADASAPLGSFRLRVIPDADAAGGSAYTGYIESADGSVSNLMVSGTPGNYWIPYGKRSEFYEMLSAALGYRYCAGQAYYFAATAVGPEYPVIDTETDTATAYISSERSAITTSAITVTPGAKVGYYDIKVVGGTIGGTLTEVVAGHGTKVTVNAQMPEGEGTIFLGWKEVTYGESGEEILSAPVSGSTSYTFTATKDVTLKPVFADSSEVTLLAAPDNSSDQMIRFYSGNSKSRIDYDRQSGGTAFTEGVAAIRYYIYVSTDLETPVTYFEIVPDGEGKYWLQDSNGAKARYALSGEPGNFITNTDGWMHIFIKNVFKAASGHDWNANGETYRIACQVISADPDRYADSFIGTMGSVWGDI